MLQASALVNGSGRTANEDGDRQKQARRALLPPNDELRSLYLREGARQTVIWRNENEEVSIPEMRKHERSRLSQGWPLKI